MAGYSVMVKEILDQCAGKVSLTHVLIQGGVGGLAGAGNAYLWQNLGKHRPAMIVVEPGLADCLYQSAMHNTPTAVKIEEESLMAGLSCGEVSQLGWQILEKGASDFLTIDEDLVVPAMQLLAGLDRPVVAGESGVAGLAALIAVSKQPALFKSLNLNADSDVLVLGTEGATDPQIYEQLTGIKPG
jgi:diaminopropionate ammonia-lyase